MKYFFLVEQNRKRHVISALNEQGARALAAESDLRIDYMYELTESAFECEGFLISDN